MSSAENLSLGLKAAGVLRYSSYTTCSKLRRSRGRPVEMLWDRTWRRASRGKLKREARWSSRARGSEAGAAEGLVPVEVRLSKFLGKG